MEKKEIKITIPEGYGIDKENSTFEKIVFKKEPKRWRDDEKQTFQGYYIDKISTIIDYKGSNTSRNYNVFAAKAQAKSALAMARISQIMANDERFGGVISDKEWADSSIAKFVIFRCNNGIRVESRRDYYQYLSFHTKEQRDLFLEENMDLIKDYLMIE